MRWIRSNVRWGAWGALFALAVQLTLSFGHVHVAGGTATVQKATLAASAPTSDPSSPPANPDPISHAGDFCAICALIQLAGTFTPTGAWLLEAPGVFTGASLAIAANSGFAAAPPLSFQARGPPIA